MKFEPRRLFKVTTNSHLLIEIISGSVLLTGLVTVFSVLFAQSTFHPGIVSADAEATVVIGLTFVYLASLLDRGKRNAWWISLPLYVYIVARNFWHFVLDRPNDLETFPVIVINLALPLLVLISLLLGRKLFYARSELASFTGAIGRALLVLAVTFMYGLIGFQLMDNADFHQEISWLSGAHYTVDQFGLTTDKQVKPYSKKGTLFLDSLAAVSLGSVIYVGVSLFAPIRFRLSTRPHELAEIDALLKKYPANSEDFFKLWPRDKAYFFSLKRDSALAYKVVGGTALVVSDPAGRPSSFKRLIKDFEGLCRLNGWEPAFIHTQRSSNELFEHLDYTVQKIGEEAVLDLGHFSSEVAGNKYFRNIKNRFEKAGYQAQYLKPPHDDSLIRQLRAISNDWLKRPGRSERGFMMGHFTPAYILQCNLLLALDSSGEIQGFINQIPSYDKDEANFDFLRHKSHGLSNINDFLMLSFISELQTQGYKRLNLGLAPLSGLGSDSASGIVNSTLHFVYSNGSRFYSFDGLKRFKSKYEPQWQDRYIVYRGGIPGFSRTINALMKAMRV